MTTESPYDALTRTLSVTDRIRTDEKFDVYARARTTLSRVQLTLHDVENKRSTVFISKTIPPSFDLTSLVNTVQFKFRELNSSGISVPEMLKFVTEDAEYGFPNLGWIIDSRLSAIQTEERFNPQSQQPGQQGRAVRGPTRTSTPTMINMNDIFATSGNPVTPPTEESGNATPEIVEGNPAATDDGDNEDDDSHDEE